MDVPVEVPEDFANQIKIATEITQPKSAIDLTDTIDTSVDVANPEGDSGDVPVPFGSPTEVFEPSQVSNSCCLVPGGASFNPTEPFDDSIHVTESLDFPGGTSVNVTESYDVPGGSPVNAFEPFNASINITEPLDVPGIASTNYTESFDAFIDATEPFDVPDNATEPTDVSAADVPVGVFKPTQSPIDCCLFPDGRVGLQLTNILYI